MGLRLVLIWKEKTKKMLCESFDQLKKIPRPENFSLRIRSRTVRPWI
tara:strand:- start:127 stop:267 length:141 start_codon:yes stop_codon:yes gene_type:complete